MAPERGDRTARVSVVTPYLDAAAYLEETIGSVLEQSHPNVEHILVDDGSSDGSAAIVNRFAARWPGRIRALSHPDGANLGTSATRNLGLREARGSYLCFLDADDVLLPDKIERQLGVFADDTRSDVVLGDTLYWHSWRDGVSGDEDTVPSYGIEANRRYPPGALMPLLVGRRGATPCICSFLMRREVLQLTGEFEESIPTLYEDQVFLVKLFSRCEVRVVEGHLEKYRQRHDSVWHRSLETGDDEIARAAFLEWLYAFAEAEGIGRETLDRWRQESGEGRRRRLMSATRRVLLRAARAVGR